MNAERRARGMACCLAPLVTAAVLLLIYAVNGIYPFGTATVAAGDLEQTYAAMYEQFADILAGRQSFFYSFMTGMGTALCSDTMNGAFFSPLNLLLLLVPQGGIMRFLSFFVLMKVMLVSLSGAWYASKRFQKLSGFYGMFFGIAYGLSGYVFMQYHNIIWLEAVALTPVLLYAAEKLIRGGKMLPYVLLLGGMLLMQYYLTAMVCIFIFLVGGAYILFLLPKGERGKAALRIAAATALGLMIGSVTMVTSLMQLSGAARMSRENTGLFTAFSGYSFSRGMALCTASFGLVLIPLYLLRLLKSGRKRQGWFTITALLIMLVPLFIDGTDNLWHFGGHIAFPYRYGFLTVFLVLALCSAYLSEPAATESNRLSRWMASRRGTWVFSGVLGGVLLIFLYLMLRSGRRINDYLDWQNYKILLLTLVSAALYALVFMLPCRRLKKALLLGVMCIQALSYGVSLIPPRSPAITLDTSSAVRAADLSGCFEEMTYTKRVKNEDGTLTLNYGRFLRQPTLSAFTGSMTQNMMDTMKALGYGVSTYSIQDCGGTLFTDAIFGEAYMVTENNRFRTDPAYVFRSSAAGYDVYDALYTAPFGLVGTSDLLTIDPGDNADPFNLQNNLFYALSSSGRTLITELDWDVLEKGTQGAARVNVTGQKRLYLADISAGHSPLLVVVRTVDGQTVTTTLHPQVYYDGILDLGSYGDETVEITVQPQGEALNPQIVVGLLDMELLEAFLAQTKESVVTFGKGSLTVDTEAQTNGDVLFLPLQAQQGWQCKVDGQTVQVERLMNALLCVRLTAGVHRVELTYRTPLLGACCCIALFGMAGAALLWAYEYRWKRQPALQTLSPGLERTVALLLWMAFVGAMAVAYAAPTIFALVNWAKHL